MKYKTLLLLVFALILTQTIYGQLDDAEGGWGTGGGNVSQWSGNVRINVFGEFVEGTLTNSITTLNANIWWLGNTPMPGNGLESIHGSFNISISAGEVISVSVDYGGKGECSLRMYPGENGSAALYLAYSGDVTIKGINAGGTYLMYIGTVYKDYPDMLFDKNDNLIDRKTKQPIIDPTTGKPITKAQLDAEKKAAADATKLNNFLINYGVSADSFLPGDSLFGGDGPPLPIYTGVPSGVTLGDATVYNADGSIAGYWVVGKSGKWWWLDPNKYKKYQELKDSLKKQNSE